MLVGDQVLMDYDAWLERQSLAVRTRAAYRRWVREFLEHLEAGGVLERFFGPDGEHDRRSAVADWRRRLVDRRLAPATVNLAVAAVTSLLDSRAMRPPDVPRVEVDPKAPRALSQLQLRALQRETDRLPSSRDRAIVQLLMLTGVRIGELAAARGRGRATHPAHRRAGHPARRGRSSAAGAAESPGARGATGMAG